MLLMTDSVSQKSRLVALLLCFFLGWLGAHRFYVGKIGTGVLMPLTFGGVFGIWIIVDLIFIACGIFRDKQDRRLFRWFEEGSI
jgi:TM2 domain-containing membrane protein YozV